MKKILVIITTNFVSWGGLTTAYMNYYRVLDKRGLLIDFASMNKAEVKLEKEVNANGGKYYQLADKRQKPVKYLFDLNKLLKNKSYDVIHVHGNSATMAAELVLAKKNGVKIRIAHCHTSKTLHPLMNKILYPFFNNLYTIGAACSKEAGNWLFKKEFLILNNAIDIKKYSFDFDKRLLARNKLKLNDNTFVVGNIGKFNIQKNHIFIIKIFVELLKMKENSCLLLIGDGPLRKEVEKQVENYGLSDKVIFIGMSNKPEFWLNAMDCFLFPSINEGFGLALAEAQANGIICFASDVIPKKADATNTVNFISLNETPKSWAHYIFKTDVTRMKKNYINEKFYKARLDINTETDKLRNLYLLGE